MQDAGNMSPQKAAERLNIRIARNALSFSVADKTAVGQALYRPYMTKNGISAAANLREALRKENDDFGKYMRSLVLVDSPVLLIPSEEYDSSSVEQLYNYTFTDAENSIVESLPLPGLDAVAAFAVEKDVKNVVEDHFTDVRYIPLMQPVWNHLHRKGESGERKKLFAYFHDGKMDVFSFHRNRFRFCNNYDIHDQREAVYFVLFVWKQLAFQSETDELYLVGNLPSQDEMMQTLHKYLLHAVVINPAVELENAPVARLKGMPYDLMVLFAKGR